jgi:hypothetical protein
MCQTMVRRQLRCLEAKAIIHPAGTTKGGRGKSTSYVITPEKAITRVLGLDNEKPITVETTNPSHVCTKTHHTGDDDGFIKGKREGKQLPSPEQGGSPEGPEGREGEPTNPFLECSRRTKEQLHKTYRRFGAHHSPH